MTADEDSKPKQPPHGERRESSHAKESPTKASETEKETKCDASTSQTSNAPEKSSIASPVMASHSREPVKKRPSQLGAMAGRKKRKSLLGEMSAAITSQPKKLNTLEKSKMDWEAYKGNTSLPNEKKETMSASEREELEAQTQGGGSGLGDVKGYLHRKEFLDRVQDRINAQEYEAHVSKRRS
ncbi:Swr1 complex protein [Malassezia pachydermatis]